MSLSEEQFREQLVDYLYGELDGAQREAFEATLAGSAQRRAELDAMKATLRSARTGLVALSEEPPARLRAAILDAERASRASVVPLKAWYRRGSTVAPLLAAAAALTFAVLAPRRDQQPQVRHEDEAYGSRNEAPAAPAPAVESAPQADAPEGEGVATAKKSDAPRASSVRAHNKAGRASGVAPRTGSPADDREEAVSGFAKPPPGWGAGVGPSADKAARDEAEPAAEPRASDVREQPLERRREPRPMRAQAPAPVSTSAASVVASVGAAKPVPDAGVARAPDELVERARGHMAAHRWAEAVIAYRELLQRFPKDERAATWRSELGSAARALSAVPLAP